MRRGDQRPKSLKRLTRLRARMTSHALVAIEHGSMSDAQLAQLAASYIRTRDDETQARESLGLKPLSSALPEWVQRYQPDTEKGSLSA